MMGGYGLQEIKSAAVKWYRRGAEAGATFAMKNYADMLYDGRGIEMDKIEAKKWYQKAADAGDESAIDAIKEKY